MLNFYKGTPDEERSYGLIFFVCVMVLTAVTVWMFYDEFVTRRPWKDYQLEADKIEYMKIKQKYEDEKLKIAEKEKKITEELENIKKEVSESNEYKSIKGELASLEIDLFDANQDYKFAKSYLDEAYYWYKHSLHEGHDDVTDKKNILAEMQKKADTFAPAIKKLEDKKLALEKVLKKITSREYDLNSTLMNLKSGLDIYKANMDSIKKNVFFLDFYRIPQIKQVVITGLDKGNFGEPLMRVDRCESCHTAIDKEEFENEEQPHKTHPNKKLYLTTHNKEKFGCSTCHMGQGPALLNVEAAHGEFHHINEISPGFYEPLYKDDMMFASCRKCHEDQFSIEGAEPITKGKQLFIELGCHGCHLSKGYGELRKAGPSLKKIGSKVDSSWLYRWVKKPKDYLPKTKMPFFDLSDEDAEAVTAYLIASSDKDYSPDIKFDYNKGKESKGRKLFKEIGCLGCHSFDNEGSDFAPDLTSIGKKVDKDWLISWIKNPKQYNPNTIMPSLRLTDEEAENIAVYLISYSKVKTIAGLKDRIKNEEIIKKGERVIRNRGCFACHEINGMEKEQRIAPELTSYGNKRLAQLEFGDSHVDRNWDAWTRNKIKNPSVYRTERVLDRMPDFGLSDGEINNLTVLLKSFRGIKVPSKFKRVLNDDEESIENGRFLVKEFNCKGCHVIENEGGDIRKHYKTINEAPPVLEGGDLHEGEKVQGLWLFGFLKKPHQIRPWLKVRMPTFYFTDEEVTTLTRYFGALAKSESIYDYIEQRDDIDTETMEAAKLLISSEYFDCFDCHSFGTLKPSGPKKRWAPNLKNVKKRLKPDWIAKWLKSPEKIQPRTKMPNFFESDEDIPEDILGGDPEKQIAAIRDFLLHYGEFDREQ